MTPRVRLAARASVALALVELGLAELSVATTGDALFALTGTRAAPSLLPEILVEVASSPASSRLATAFAPLVAAMALVVALEPFLFVAYARAHLRPEELPATRLLHRGLQVVAMRLLGLSALCIPCAILALLATVHHVATKAQVDPRTHDLGLLGFAAVGAVLTALAHFAAELAALRLATRDEPFLVACSSGVARTSPRLLVARVVSSGVALLFGTVGATLAVGRSAPAALALAAASTAAALWARSVYLAFAIDDE